MSKKTIVPILIVAGLIEGFVSPTGLATGLKFSLAASLFVLLLAYLFAAGGPTTDRKSRNLQDAKPTRSRVGSSA